MSSGEADAVRVEAALRQFLAIAGIPGSGKSTLAAGLADHYGGSVIATGDIARRVDPSGLAAGGLADEVAFREAWYAALLELPLGLVIFDGIPRSYSQLAILPAGTRLLGLTCRPDIARARLLWRGRSDDTAEVIGRRIFEQRALLEVDRANGWLYREAGWGRVVNTSLKEREQVLSGFVGFLDGITKEAF